MIAQFARLRRDVVIGAVEVDQPLRLAAERDGGDAAEEYAVGANFGDLIDAAVEADDRVREGRRSGAHRPPFSTGKALFDTGGVAHARYA